MENYGSQTQEDAEESSWGPYVTLLEIDKPFSSLDADDVLLAFGGSTAETHDYDGSDEWLMFDLYRSCADAGDPACYCRLNFYVTEVN